MKQIFILILLLGLVSCEINPKSDIGDEVKNFGDFKIKVIDSCEYIEYDNGVFDQRVYALCHKGNCKFCIQRAKRK